MFNNIGSKVKTLAQVTCWIGIISSLFSGVIMIYTNGNLIVPGILTIVFGSLFSWIGSLGLYAIGEAAENSAIAANLAVKADMEKTNQPQKRTEKHNDVDEYDLLCDE